MQLKKRLLSVLFVAFLFSLSINSFATHIFGGELLYKNISGNTYAVTLTIYGDCQGTAFPGLRTATPRIYIYNGDTLTDSITLASDTVGLEVSPVCAKEIGNTTCSNLNSTLRGVKRYIFPGEYTFPGTSATWRLIFSAGLHPESIGNDAGRSDNITNIATGSLMQLEATLNNLSGPNNSPVYSTIPTPFYCVNLAQDYNQGAIDPDGDSLSFSLVPGIGAPTFPGNPLDASPVSYISPCTATAPLKTVAGSYSFNALNGQLSFTTNEAQRALIVNQVSEYRNGILVGTSKREMAFVISDDCLGTPPTMHIGNIDGGALTSSNIIKICAGTPHLNFNLNLNNPDGDSTEIALGDLPPGSSLIINNNNTSSPNGSFSWNTDTLTLGVYTFYAYIKNNHCPIANRQTLAYTINVVPLPTLSQAQIGPTNCTHQAPIRYNLAYGYLPRIVTITQGSAFIKALNDSTGLIIDSLPAGNYTIYASSNPLCQVSDSISVIDSGKLLIGPYQKSYCKGDSAVALRVPVPGPGTTVTWYDNNDIVLPAAPVPSTAVPGITTWHVVESYKVCTSDKVPASAVIHDLPDIKILSRSSSICYGDTIDLEASGGVAYTWTPADRIGTTADGKLYTRLVNEGTFQVRANNEFGCIDSTAITFDHIQPCCSFFYPNAFTPNATTNNGFKILTHGNMFDYRLAIFNRWGQMVYLSVDQRASWDGKLYGTPCEAGTYYYHFNARCLTGIMEEKTGDVTLIR